METQPRALIGIDPDTVKSGFALYEPGKRVIRALACYDLVELMQQLLLHQQLYKLKVHLEAGWLSKATWHKGGNNMAKRVGANHEIGRQIEKFCAGKGIEVKLMKPQGYSSWTHEIFCRVTKWPLYLPTNSEKRVAGMMVYGY